MKEVTRSRRSSPLSHSGSVNQHLGRQTQGERFMASGASSGQRRSHSRERSEELSGGIKSRIPLPVRILPDKDDLSSSGGDSHYMASPEPATGHVSSHVSGRDHVHSGYVSSRYSDRYQPSSSYISSYNPSHLYTDYTVSQSAVYGSGYRPTSAKDYNRYNYYSTVNTEPDSYLSGTGTGSSSSPRWRRRSYDHDSDYLRYQRRTSGRASTSTTLADYPPAQPSSTAPSSSALTR